jgi:hypothetical protein
MISTGLPSVRPQDEILVMYCSSPATYGIRLTSHCPGVFPFPTSARVASSDAARAPSAIGLTEHDELAALRKSQAWGTPMFQPNHPRYAQLISRLRELEAKELATA